jgi:hypothetical protein
VRVSPLSCSSATDATEMSQQSSPALTLRCGRPPTQSDQRTFTAHWSSFQILSWSIIAFGASLRCMQYLADRSLWLDEAFLALNIVHRSFTQLLQPLDHNQGAPIAFLLLEKVLIQTFGDSEYALRLLPLLSGIISLLLFYKLAVRYVVLKAVPIALGLYAISGPLIYYSSEVKQYSSDAAVSVMLYLLAAWALEEQRLSFQQSVLLAAIGSAAIWFSHPTVFILAGAGPVLFLFQVHKRAWSNIVWLSVVYALWAVNFIVLYSISLHNLSNNQTLLDYWADSFMPLPPTSFSDVKWFAHAFLQMFRMPVGVSLPGLAGVICVIGCYSFITGRKAKLFILTLPIALTLLASGLHKYPFGGRLLLFIAPPLMLLLAEGVVRIADECKANAARVQGALVALLFFQPLLAASYHLINPRVVEEIRPVASYVKQHWQSGDLLYVDHNAWYAFAYYQTHLGFADTDYVVGTELSEHWDNWNDCVTSLNELRGRKRVWILFSHVQRDHSGRDEEQLILRYLNGIGYQQDVYHSTGAVAYLYDLQRFSFEREDMPFSVGWDKAAGRSQRDCPGRKRGAYSGLPSFSLHSSANRCK